MPAFVLGTHLTGLAVLRRMTARGVSTYGLDRTKDMIIRSRWYRSAESTLTETTDSGELERHLRGLRLRHAVLIPCSDRWCQAVAGLSVETRQRFPSSIAPRPTMAQMLDKEAFRRLIAGLAIPHPATRLLERAADLSALRDDQLAGAFLKPTESHRYFSHFGTKGQFVTSRRQAAHMVERGHELGISLLLQEWIPGDTSQTILIDGFVDRRGDVCAVVARRRLRMEPPRLANTCSSVTIPLSEVEGAVASVRRLLDAVSYRGIFNVEFKFDRRDGQFKIIEVNPRATWYAAHLAAAGVDLPWMSYLDAQDLPVPKVKRYQTGRYGIYEIADAAAIVRAWTNWRKPEGPVLMPWLRGDRTLFWWRDPVPAMVDGWHAIQRRTAAVVHRPRRPRPSHESASDDVNVPR